MTHFLGRAKAKFSSIFNAYATHNKATATFIREDNRRQYENTSVRVKSGLSVQPTTVIQCPHNLRIFFSERGSQLCFAVFESV